MAVRAAYLGAILLGAGLVAGPVLAQTLEQPRPGDRRLELPPLPPAAPEGRFELPPVPTPPADAPLSSGPGFVLRGVRFTGNEVVSTADLAAVAAPWLGRAVGTEDLEALRRALTALYVERGYINSGAVLPDQRVADGVVGFVLVEGELSRIVVTGTERLRPGYVEERLAQAAGPPLDVGALQRRFRILLDDPLIDRLDAELAPGVRPGESELRVAVQEANPVHLTVTAANDRSPSVGGEALEADLLLRNPAGWGETLHARYARASGLRELDAGFSFPVNAYDTRIGLRGQLTDSEVVEEPFSLLDVISESSEAEVSLSHPLYRAVGQELQVSLLGQRRRSETRLLGRRFSFSEGPQDGVSTVAVARLVLDWIDRSQDRVLAVRLTGSQGLEVLDATSNSGNGFPDSDFRALLAQAQYVRRTPWLNTTLVLRADAQFTGDRLLPLEKFAIGGAGTVRGYRENAQVRDNGIVFSVEARIPVWQAPIPGLGDQPGDGQVELAAFYDYGRAWDVGDADNSPRRLDSVGLGLRWAPARHIRGAFYVARRLSSFPVPVDSDPQDHGVHFRLSIDLP